MLFLGIDWGEHHHDLCLLDQDGRVLMARRIGDGLAGVGELHALVASHVRTQRRSRWGSRPTGVC
jgi:Transposase